MYYTYMLRCSDNTIYTGMTANPQRRWKEHFSGGSRAAKYTRSHKAVKFLALWQSDSRSLACQLEHFIKTLSKSQKEHLAVSGDLSLYADYLSFNRYTFVPLAEMPLVGM